MPRATVNAPPRDLTEPGATSAGPGIDSEITWLLHRAAQRMRTATGEQAEKHGIQLRDHIVLSALNKTPGLTQIELGKALGLDKTTLMSQLDRLESAGLIERHGDPRDRRARVPQITETGEAVRSSVADASEHVEAAALHTFSGEQVALLRRMLFEIIGESNDPGSCL
jgi:MarR family transcriptional regulator, organic hydroperoxide resistance regulator